MITKQARNPQALAGLTSSVLYPTTIQTNRGPALVLFTRREIDRAIARGRRIEALCRRPALMPTVNYYLTTFVLALVVVWALYR